MEYPSTPNWLEESYLDPKTFWQELLQLQAEYLPAGCKSTPFGQYDLYHDTIVRNLDFKHPAFCWYDPVQGWQELSFKELADSVNRKSSSWRKSHVEPGQKICIIRTMGVQFIIAVLAALKSGLIISILPPSGSTFVQNRLETLEPDHIEIDDIHRTIIPDWKEKILRSEEPASDSQLELIRSHSYASGEILAMLFDPTAEISREALELSIDEAYLCPFRDGMISLNLRPGQVLAAPGFRMLETQPGLLFSAWLNGATYMHIDLTDLEDKPELLMERPVNVIGVSNKLRDLIIKNKLEIGKQWDFWFRNPAADMDFRQWQLFIEIAKLGEVLTGNLKWEASRGGCVLFSPKRAGQIHWYVLPSAGVSYQIADMSEPGMESLSNSGLLAVSRIGSDADEWHVTTNLISKNRAEFTYLSSRVSGRQGLTYPCEEVLNVINEEFRDFSYSLFDAPVHGELYDPLYVLLIFTGGEKVSLETEHVKQVRELVESKMGDEFYLDRIHLIPLYPRKREDGSVDHDWCRDQYLSGGILRKSKNDIFLNLAKIRRGIHRKQLG